MRALWETIKREFWERVHPQDLSDARQRLAQWIAHYNFFRTRQGMAGLVPADPVFGAESPLRKTLQSRLPGPEFNAALGEARSKGVYPRVAPRHRISATDDLARSRSKKTPCGLRGSG